MPRPKKRGRTTHESYLFHELKQSTAWGNTIDLITYVSTTNRLRLYPNITEPSKNKILVLNWKQILVGFYTSCHMNIVSAINVSSFLSR